MNDMNDIVIMHTDHAPKESYTKMYIIKNSRKNEISNIL